MSVVFPPSILLQLSVKLHVQNVKEENGGADISGVANNDKMHLFGMDCVILEEMVCNVHVHASHVASSPGPPAFNVSGRTWYQKLPDQRHPMECG